MPLLRRFSWSRWRVVVRSWLRRTILKQWWISFLVGCFGAGWILWLFDQVGNRVGRVR